MPADWSISRTAGLKMTWHKLYFLTALALSCLTAPIQPSAAADWTTVLPGNFGGHLEINGRMSHLPEDSLLTAAGRRTLRDGTGELRLTWRHDFLDNFSITAHYENLVSGGDTRSQVQEIQKNLPRLSSTATTALLDNGVPKDDRRLFGLTGQLDEDENHIWYHRLDRLFLSWRSGTLDIRAGRQAVTWGNGLIFNPMDLFNPFSPIDVVRDYKTGDDLLSVELNCAAGNLHLLCVPRRDPADHKVSRNHSSVAAKYHCSLPGLEMDFMAGRHYRDWVAGTGLTGYLGPAAWRLDGVLTIPDDDDILWTGGKDHNTYLSLIANVDLSWFWCKKNWYGFLELYYNGLMSDDYARDTAVPYITERLHRGDLYNLGKLYATAMIQFEAHPLVNLYLTGIVNLNDPSGVLLPRLIYDITQNGQITLGGNLNVGSHETEYGGWDIPNTGLINSPPDTVYLRITRFF